MTRFLPYAAILPLFAFALLVAPLSAQGRIVAWADDTYGQVTDVPPGADFVQISAGTQYAVALKSDGSLVSWGRDLFGSVNDTPTGSGFMMVAAAGAATMALRADGSIVTWGFDDYGQVTNTPTRSGFIHISGGRYHCLAVHSDGTLSAWGRDNFGQVSGVPSGDRFTQAGGGIWYSAALGVDGSLYAWGADHGGQVTEVPPGNDYTLLAAANSYGLALHTDGSLEFWGAASSSAIGAGVPPGTGFIRFGIGMGAAAALHSDGSLTAWGLNPGGLVSSAPTGLGFVDVAMGDAFGVALLAQNVGAASCFGDGSGAACPCGSPGNPGEGCANSSGGGGATLSASGDAFLKLNTFQLHVTGIPGSKVGLCVKGSTALGGGLGSPVGDGLLCTASQLRSQVILSDVAGNLSMPNWRGQPFSSYPNVANVGGPTFYQWWYRDPASTCTGAGFNFTNGWTANWLP